MRVLMAVMVLSLGMVSVWAGGKGPQQGPKQTQVGTKQKSVSQPNTNSNLRKSSPPSPAQEGTDFYGSWLVSGVRSWTSVRFVWINPGTFQMGYTGGLFDIPEDEVPQHPVTLTRGFWLLDHEVTQGEYQVVMGSNPSGEKTGVDRPVWSVTWEKAVEFCQKLTVWDRVAGRITWQQEYRLPTEAEWEYAACAGTTGFQGSDDTIGWYGGAIGPQPVKQLAANGWGLYDMVGNVWEWCADWYGKYPAGSVTDPTGPSSGSFRVNRGGSWIDAARNVRSAARRWNDPGHRDNLLGFRPALSSVR